VDCEESSHLPNDGLYSSKTFSRAARILLLPFCLRESLLCWIIIKRFAVRMLQILCDSYSQLTNYLSFNSCSHVHMNIYVCDRERICTWECKHRHGMLIINAISAPWYPNDILVSCNFISNLCALRPLLTFQNYSSHFQSVFS